MCTSLFDRPAYYDSALGLNIAQPLQHFTDFVFILYNELVKVLSTDQPDTFWNRLYIIYDAHLQFRPTLLFRYVPGGERVCDSGNISLYRMTINHSLSVRRVYGVYHMHVHTCR